MNDNERKLMPHPLLKVPTFPTLEYVSLTCYVLVWTKQNALKNIATLWYFRHVRMLQKIFKHKKDVYAKENL